MVRRTVALGAGLVVLILLVLLFRGCLDARKERAIKDYVGASAALIDESNQDSRSFFDLMNGRANAEDPVAVENALNGLRVESAQRVDRARDLDAPDEVSAAQSSLVQVLSLRRDALNDIADALPRAISDDGQREGTSQVAQDMQVLLASDVLYGREFVRDLDQALRDQDLRGEVSIPRSQFVPDVTWVDPSTVADKVGAIRAGGGGDEEAAPGLHGNGLASVSLGGVALTPGAPVSVALSDDLQFEVQVANQCENTETDVNVVVRVGEGDDAITLEEPIDEIAAGETKSVTLPLGEQPPTGQSVPVEVEVEPVPGEDKTDNNSATYTVIFTS
jgi:hypothetical protein